MAWKDLLSRRPSPSLAGDKIQRGVLVITLSMLIAMIVISILLGVHTHSGGAGPTYSREGATACDQPLLAEVSYPWRCCSPQV